MSENALRPRGPFAILDGHEYFVSKPAGWNRYVLGSAVPRPGFELDERGRYLRPLTDDDRFECVEYVHDATYLGKFVALGGGKGGSVWVWADTGHTNSVWSNAETRAAGFEWQEPGVWRREVRLDDPDLVVVTSRVRVDPPWLKKSEG